MTTAAPEISGISDLCGSFRAMAASFWRVPSKSAGYVPFIMRPGQFILDNEYERQMDERGFVRINSLKCRQVANTTWARLRAHHYTQYREAVTALSVAHEQRLPEQWLQWTRDCWERTPPQLRPERETTQGHVLRYSHGSRYYIGSAQAGFVGVGDTIHFLHLSELGRWDKPPISVDPQSVLYPLNPAIPAGDDRFGSVVIRESTGVMRGDYWYRTYQAGKERDSEYVNLFLPWFLVPEYRRDDRVREIVSLTEYEQSIVREARRWGVVLDKAMLAWRRMDIRQDPFFGDEELWAAEFPAVEDEAFMSPGLTVYNAEEIRKARSTEREPLWRGEILPKANPVEFELVGSDAGNLVMFDHDPRRGQRPAGNWAIGADCQWGVKGDDPDYDAAASERIEDGRLGCYLHGRWPMGDYARMLAALGYYYSGDRGPARLAPERNTEGGKQLIRPLMGLAANDWSYPRLYVWSKDKHFGAYAPEDLGWQTDKNTKPALIAMSHQFLLDGYFDWAWGRAIDEMASIIKREDLSVGAPEGAHDDLWMARLIAARVAHEERVSRSAEPYSPDLSNLSDYQRRIMEHVAERDERDSGKMSNEW